MNRGESFRRNINISILNNRKDEIMADCHIDYSTSPILINDLGKKLSKA